MQTTSYILLSLNIAYSLHQDMLICIFLNCSSSDTFLISNGFKGTIVLIAFTALTLKLIC